MTDDPADKAAALARHLREGGNIDASARFDSAVSSGRQGSALLEALREACQSVLTAVEAIDPASFAAIEEFRLDVDKRLDTGHTSG